MIGTGWSHTYDWRIYETEQYYVVHRGNGRMDYYHKTTFAPLFPNIYNQLDKNGDEFTLTTPEKTKYTFGFMSTSDEDKKKGYYLKEITDRYGNPPLTITYASGQMQTITDPVGRSITMAYDANGHLTEISDPQLGRTLSFSVDETSKNLMWYSDFMGRKTHFDYEAAVTGENSHRVTTITDPAGVVRLTNAYDDKGRLISQTDALSRTTTYSYNSDETTITDPLGNTTVHQNNVNYELTTSTDPATNAATYQYTDHKLSTFIDRRQNRSEYDHNEYGRITQTDHTIENGDHITTTTQYTDANFPAFPTVYTDSMTESTHYTYDNVTGSLLTVEDPLGKTVSRTYTASGQLETFTNKRGQTTHYTYGDPHKNLTQVSLPSGSVETYVYDDAGRKTSVTNKRGHTTFYEYDANNNLIKITDPLTNETTFAYDLNNRLVSKTDAKNHTITYTYNDSGQLLTQTSSEGLTVTYTYNQRGQRERVIDPAGKETQYSYDERGNLIKITNALSFVEFEYDENGNLLKVIDSHGNEVENQYDKMDRLANTSDPLNKTTHYSYWKNGNVFTRLDAMGVITEYFYDKLGRLTKISYPDGSDIDFAYDDNGNLTAMVDAAGTTTCSYDTLDRLTGVNDSFGNDIAYTYDAENNRTSITYPGNKTVSYAYDGLNRLTKVTDWLGGETAYQYDTVGNVTRIDNPNNSYTRLTYDNDNRLTALENYKQDGSIIASYAYSLDAAGNITEISSVEPLEPIIPGESTTYSYNNANQLISDGTNTYAYDDNGNLIERSGSQNTAFTYNYENMLTSISGTIDITNTYNGFGMRVARLEDGTQTRYILDMASSLPSVLAETNASGTITAYYIHGLGLISRITPSGNRLVYHFNHRGDTVALTDASGNLTDSYAYDEYGKIANSSGSTENPFKYVGKYGVMDEGDDFFFMRARYYNAETGRFLSKDPIGFAGGDWNLYAYVAANPVVGIDPTGLLSEEEKKEFASTYVDNVLKELAKGEALTLAGVAKDVAKIVIGYMAASYLIEQGYIEEAEALIALSDMLTISFCISSEQIVDAEKKLQVVIDKYVYKYTFDPLEKGLKFYLDVKTGKIENPKDTLITKTYGVYRNVADKIDQFSDSISKAIHSFLFSKE